MTTPVNCYTNHNEVTDIEGCFKAIVSKKPVSLSVGTAYKIMQKLCKLPITAGEHKLKSVMPHMLVHHISNWPGWNKYQKYVTGQISYDKWLDTFKNYLTYKLNYVVKNDFKVALYQHLTEDKDKLDGQSDPSKQKEIACQTDTGDRPFAPFTVLIHVPAMHINTMVFVDAPEGAVILKHHIQPNWNFIDLKLLINWPYMTVKFASNELVVKRRNVHECVRFLSDPSFKNTIIKPDFIEEVDLINPNKMRSSYSLNLMQTYCDKYLEYFKSKVDKYPNALWKDILYETEIYFKEFLADIKDININNSIASNTYVLFNIGGHVYTRNKKIRCPTEGPPICLFEVLTPKVETSLISFYGVVTDANGKTHFRTLNDPDSDPPSFVPPTIEYTCTYCHVKFLNSKSATKHLYTKHTTEPALLCKDCKLQFSVIDLVNNRWHHVCRPHTTNSVVPDF